MQFIRRLAIWYMYLEFSVFSAFFLSDIDSVKSIRYDVWSRFKS